MPIPDIGFGLIHLMKDGEEAEANLALIAFFQGVYVVALLPTVLDRPPAARLCPRPGMATSAQVVASLRGCSWELCLS